MDCGGCGVSLSSFFRIWVQLIRFGGGEREKDQVEMHRVELLRCFGVRQGTSALFVSNRKADCILNIFFLFSAVSNISYPRDTTLSPKEN